MIALLGTLGLIPLTDFMTVSTDSLKKYVEGLQADLAKAKERKEQALKIGNEADNQIKTLDGALQFAALLIQESEKSDKPESSDDPATEDTEVVEAEAQ